MNRFEKTFETTRNEGRKALVTFIMAGDPDEGTTLQLLNKIAQDADILEIGMPFSDPMADGPAIQAAGLRALENGTSLKTVFSIVQQFRSNNNVTPIVLMGYFNPVFTYGIEKFMKDCKAFGVDGLILVDIPPEEAGEVTPQAQQNDIAFIRLLTPTTDEKRLQTILKDASGFLYYVSIAGVTGTASADPAKVGAHIAQIKKHTDLPVVAGFGIRTAEDAKAMAGMADGIVVGSAIVQTIAAEQAGNSLLEKVEQQVKALAGALKTA